MLMMIAPKMASQKKEFTWNPMGVKDMIHEVNMSIAALMMTANKPSVRHVMGMDKKEMIGLTMAFTRPKMAPIAR